MPKLNCGDFLFSLKNPQRSILRVLLTACGFVFATQENNVGSFTFQRKDMRTEQLEKLCFLIVSIQGTANLGDTMPEEILTSLNTLSGGYTDNALVSVYKAELAIYQKVRPLQKKETLFSLKKIGGVGIRRLKKFFLSTSIK